MSELKHYAEKYENIKLTREDGLLQMTLHSEDGSLVWCSSVHTDLVDAFYQIACDPGNRVVILTNAGDDFCADVDVPSFALDASLPPIALDRIYREGRDMLLNQVNVPCPMIAAIHGRALIHSELALFCDIILASETASFQDGHVANGLVAGDGVHIAYPMAFGMQRGRRMILTSEVVTAQKALEYGCVSEVLPYVDLLPRALAIAKTISKAPTLTLRYTREVLVREIARQLRENLAFGLALEGFGSGMGFWTHAPGSPTIGK